MSALWDWLISIANELNPIRHVAFHQRGILLLFNHAWKLPWMQDEVLEPGIYVIVPFLMDIHPIEIRENVLVGSKQDMTLVGGDPVTFQLALRGRVVDPLKVAFNIDDSGETAVERMEGIAAQMLYEDVQGDNRFETSQKRRNFLLKLRDRLNSETMGFGVEVSEVWFSTFVLKVSTRRLIMPHIG